MIARYTRPEMAKVWELENKFANLLEVEKAVAKVQAKAGVIPKAAALAISRNGKFDLTRIEEIEQTTRHDVIAFVTNVAENVGPNGRFVHFGMTSSDVLDTAHSLTLREAAKVLNESHSRLDRELTTLIVRHKYTLCAGRTHGMHAEPTTFGLKMSGHLVELRRVRRRFDEAIRRAAIVKLSGPVGTYSTQSEKIEAGVGELLKLRPEVVATQVVPRDRHAGVIVALGFLGACLERLAIELRHLQRTEVGEAEEGFAKGQKGSSAMPHKRNPISAENITGLARMLRSHVTPSLENISLWHERDISHSSVERVIFPDAFILADYATDRMASLLKGLNVYPERMLANMNISQGQLFSAQVLLALVQKGLSREDAYALVQSVSHGLKSKEHLSKSLLKSKEVREHLTAAEIRALFSGRAQKSSIEKIISRALRYKGDE